jgi:hypothetical protein
MPPCVVDCEKPLPHAAATAIKQIAALLIFRTQLICIWSPERLLLLSCFVPDGLVTV